MGTGVLPESEKHGDGRLWERCSPQCRLKSNRGLGRLLSWNLAWDCGSFFESSMCCVLPHHHTNGLIISRFRESETGKGVAAWDQFKEFALISYTPVKKLLHTPGSQSIAIIETRENHAEPDSLQIKYICRVTLIPTNKETMNACKQKRGEEVSVSAVEAKDSLMIEERLLDEEHQWCVL